MKKFKAVWKYVVGMMIFLPLWFVLLAVSFLASVSLFIFFSGMAIEERYA